MPKPIATTASTSRRNIATPPSMSRDCPGTRTMKRHHGSGLGHACGAAGDEPRPAPVGPEAHQPADDHQEPVLEADQVPDVDDQPHEPGERPAEAHHAQVGDGPAAADGG